MGIVEMSVQAGVLIAAIVIVRAITLYRLPKASFLALWGIVVARLLIPFSLTSKWSVYNLFAGLWGHKDTAVPTGSYVTVWGGQSQVPASPEAAGGPVGAVMLIPPLTALWIGGMAVLVVVFAVLLAKNYRALRTAVPVEDHAVITKWREEYRLFRPLAIVRSDKVSSPASIGILRPRIIFPQVMDLDNEQLVRYILVHEYVHIRRFDTLWKLLALCAVCVHWFNPLVWVMLVLLNRDLELSCDEMVLRHFGGAERASYAHSLIDMAERGRPFSFMHSYFSKNAVEERIIAIMKYKKTSLLAVVLALVLTLGMATGFTTGAVAKDNNSSLPNGQPSASQRNNEETGPHDNESTPSGLISVNRGDESKFTPEEWAEILKKVEAGEILLFETAKEERAFWDNEDNAALKESLFSKGSISMRWEDFQVLNDVPTNLPNGEMMVNIVTGATGFSTTDGSDSRNAPTDVAAVQIAKEALFEKVAVDKAESNGDGTATSLAGVSFSNEKSTKTSIAAQSEVFYKFGSGSDKTFYEKDTDIAFTIQCSHADIPLTISLLPVGSTEAVDSHKVESNEQTTIILTVPADGDYVISVRNESLSRTQEYSHMIVR